MEVVSRRGIKSKITFPFLSFCLIFPCVDGRGFAEISGGSQVDIEERRLRNDVMIVPRIINGGADDER